jgi:hypothetical protein
MKKLLTLAFAFALPTAAAAQPAASFDWSVPDRYTVDGMLNVRVPVTASPSTLRILNPEGRFGDVPPSGWPADFTACGAQTGAARYIWSVDGLQVGETSECATRIMFPREGQYRVELTVIGGLGSRSVSVQDVNIQDWLIIGLGDSYGSGEGIPNVPVTPQGLGDFEAAHAAWAVASDHYQEAAAAVAAAQAEVDAAQRDLDTARNDLDQLQAALTAYDKATQTLQDAQDAVAAANAAVVRATAAVAAAVAKVAFECAQVWDPAGCTAAKSALSQAKQAETAAIAARSRAVTARNAAAADLVVKATAIPAEGFEYARGLIDARIALMTSRVNVAATALENAKQFALSSNEILQAAVQVLYERAGGAVALWQDSKPANGRILVNEEPFYEPHSYSQCHQSKFSGQALAALAIEQADPKTSVTFIHLACSGGTIPAGIVGEYEGIEKPRQGTGGNRPAQIEAAVALSSGREVDAFVMSIGGNDIGFSHTIMECVTKEPCFAPTEQVLSDQEIDSVCDSYAQGPKPVAAVSAVICKAALKKAAHAIVGSNAQEEFFKKLASLPKLYGQVETKLREHWPGLPSNRMFLTQYPMVTRDHNNDVCAAYQDPEKNLPGISGAEYLWAEQVVATLLNQTIADQEQALGWNVVKGIDEAFRLHGYCSDDSWIVRIKESFATQVGMSGTAHPTARGQMAYAEQIAGALRKAFYPQSSAAGWGPSRVAAVR